MDCNSKEPMLGFSPELFEERRKTVFSKLDNSVLLLSSGSVKKKSKDIEFPFRPESDFFYLTGLCESECIALLRSNGSDGDLVLFVPVRDLNKERWTGERMGLEEIKKRYGATEVHGKHQLGQHLPSLLSHAGKIYFRTGTDQQLEELLLSSLNHDQVQEPRGNRKLAGILDPGSLLDDMRLFKDAEELDRIRRAAVITSESFQEMLAYCGPGVGEWELEAALEFGFRKRGASGPAYPTIVGSGGNGCVLHYSSNCQRMESGDLVLVDGGAELDLYAADITRTFPVSGSFSEIQKSVYEVVKEAHECGIKRLAPGVAIENIHEVTVMKLVEGLLELGILKGSTDEILEKETYKIFFPHKTSHWLGLDIHDVGTYMVQDRSRVLEPNMVLTVEPGLYFPSLNKGLEEFFNIGIRIEDDLLITDSGSELLTPQLPVNAEEIESLVQVSK